jgi:hypothetical protein
MRRFCLVVAFGIAILASIGSDALSQAPVARSGPTAADRALAGADFLLGQWEGDGWIGLGDGSRATFHQKETVRRAAGGAVIVIDGLGTSTDPAKSGAIVHQAFAVLSFDAQAQKLIWRAWRATGEETDDWPTVTSNRLVWGMRQGPGRVRFTIVKAGEDWNEIGEFSPDQAHWSQFFEMTLHKR